MTDQLIGRYKVLLVGDSNIGKTTYVNYLLTNIFTEYHDPTLGVDVNPYVCNTNYGPIIFELWDCAGDYKYRGIGSAYYISAKGAIIMYNESTESNCSEWEEKIKTVCNDIPIILCKNISDNDNINNNNSCIINIKKKINIKEPLLLLARKLTGYDDLEFI